MRGILDVRIHRIYEQIFDLIERFSVNRDIEIEADGFPFRIRASEHAKKLFSFNHDIHPLDRAIRTVSDSN